MWRRLPYMTSAAIGICGGATGVALAIGLVIILQRLMPPAAVLSPGVSFFLVTSTLAGLGASWLLAQVACRIVPNLLCHLYEKGLQVTLVFSILTSLFQTVLFFSQG